MPETRKFTLAVIGAGPRGLSFLERLLAHLEAGEHPAPGTTLNILVFDPHHPGSGQVWQVGQSQRLLMNTPGFYPTAAPGVGEQLPASSVGLSFEQWRQEHPEQTEGLHRADYPPRYLYGKYLESLYDHVVGCLKQQSAVESMTWLPSLVTGLSADRDGSGYVLTDGDQQWTADAAVLSLGHGPAKLNRQQQLLAGAAQETTQQAAQQADQRNEARNGLHYIPPHLPADMDYSEIPGGEHVVVRGMGLNFFDVMIELTAGRGGRFLPDSAGAPTSLRYQPSGNEPVLHVGSRRGLPYFPKIEADSFVPHGVRLRYLTEQAINALLEENQGTLWFNDHLWPLVHRDVLRTYYYTLCRQHPEIFGGVDAARQFFAELVSALEAITRGEPITGAEVQQVLNRYAPGRALFDIRRLARPFESQVYRADQTYQEQVRHGLQQLCHEAVLGEDSALMMGIGALHAARLVVKELIARGRLADPSRRNEVSGWFENLVEGVASGPPAARTEQLVALSKAGLVQFIGPDPVFDINAEGTAFIAESPQVNTSLEAHQGQWMIEAMMPANHVSLSTNPLIRDLQRQGIATPYPEEDENGVPVPGKGFNVTERPHRLIDDAGNPAPLFVLGLQLSSVQWGTAIAAEAGKDPDGRARTLGDADAAARAVLDL